MSGIRFRKEFGIIHEFSIEFGCRIIAIFEFPFKFGGIAVYRQIIDLFDTFTYHTVIFEIGDRK